MTTDEQLDAYRDAGTRVRVIRDNNESNDVKGIVVAWNEDTVIIRKQNRRVVQLPRTYAIVPFDQERPILF